MNKNDVEGVNSHRPLFVALALGKGSKYPGKINIIKADGNIRSLESTEIALIEVAIVVYSGNMSAVAKNLGMSRSTLYRKIERHGIDVPNLTT